ncbi:MAG: M28 family peptidase, partial [Hadesarchaea archaeon]|nr:M28 family peptidase [Hadesarchaea archaeon]
GRDANPKRTIEILFFGVEELGFWGSTSFVKKHEKEVEEEYKTLINLDGFSSGLCPKNFLETTPRARDFAKSIASDLEWEIDYEGEPMPLSDHIPFEEKNVPIIWIHEGLIDPYYHTEKDTFDHIDFDKLVKITRVASRCAFELASIEELEFGE